MFKPKEGENVVILDTGPFEPGDRIELIDMPDDPNPIPAGTKGTVVGSSFVRTGGGWWQVDVQWDNGRSLMLSIPPDHARKCKEERR